MELGPDTADAPAYTSHDLPVSPKLWLLLGILYVGLGGRTGRYEASSPKAAGRLLRLLLRVVLWGSAKVQQLLWRLRWLIYANGLLIATMILIHLSSPDPRPPPLAFPAACPVNKRFGCSRVAQTGQHGAARGVAPLLVEADVVFVQRAAEDWVGMQTHARILATSPGFFHARFVSFFWGFADDFYASIRCHNSSHAVVEVQGQLRLGTSDLGVNKRRNRRALEALELAARDGTIPEGRCETSASAVSPGTRAAGVAAAVQQAGQQVQQGQQGVEQRQQQQPG
ncbi:hypothetical protein N2152v2_007180 [Parachlorella kessleri]